MGHAMDVSMWVTETSTNLMTANLGLGGGMPQSVNRTYWPVSGGAVSIQPGWFQGHVKAFFYVNIGIQEPGQQAPPNMSHPVVPPFQILGPTNQEYAGQFCLPQVPMPVNVTLEVGQNITLQVVEAAQHGAALYNVCLRPAPIHVTRLVLTEL
jgi:hypothetical protein